MASPAKRPCCDVSGELTDAIAREDWTEVKNILSESSRHVADSVVTQLINEDQWNAVRRVIRCVEDEDRTWNIEGIVVKSSILLSVAERDWTCLKESPSERFPDSTFQWIIRQACTRATQSEVVHFVLPYCADDRLDCVLTILVERRQWHAVIQVLAQGVTDSTKQWAVREACEHCIENHFGTFDSRWSLLSGHPKANYSRVEQCLVDYILPHCADDQLDSVLTTLVERRLWQAVLYVLERGVSDSSKRWLVLEVCACCESVSQKKISKMLLVCADDQADYVLTTLVEQRQWLAVGVVLKKGVSDTNKQWAVREACNNCEKDDLKTLICNILPHCADDQADSVLTTLVERRLWQAVGEMLEKGVSDFNKQWAVQKACKHSKKDDTFWHLQSKQEQFPVQSILPHCADNQLDTVLTTLVELRLWQDVGVVLKKKGVSDSNKQWAVQEACKHCKKDDGRTDYTLWHLHLQELGSPVEQFLVQNILPHCAVDQLDSVMTTLVERRLWQAVGVVLTNKGVSDSNKQWAVQEACKHYKEEDGRTDYTLWHLHLQELGSPVEQFLVQNILPHCADDQLDSVLTTLVERRLWKAVMYVLNRGVSDSSKRWVVLTVFASCTFVLEKQIVSNILLFCTDDQLDSVLTTLVERRLWHAVMYVLRRGVSDSSKRWVVLEVCACCESGVQEQVQSDILLLCADDHADFVLTTLVERLHWKYVRELKLVVTLLQRGVSETLAIWAVEQARKGAKSDNFIKYVLPHCSLSHLNSAMPNLVAQGELTAVDIVMQRHRKDMEINSFVLPRWYVDVLPLFVERSLWNYVQEILHSVVKKSLYHWTKREGEINEDDSVVLAIVNTCRVNATRAVRLFRAAKEKVPSKVRELHKCLGLTEDLCELLYTSFLDQMCVELCSEEKKTDVMTDSIHIILLDIYTEITSCIQTISTNSVEGMVGHFKSEARKMTSSGKLSSSSVHHFLYFLKLLNFYYICERRNGDDEVLLMMFAVLPLSPVLQSVALRIMLRHKRWDVISHADLSRVWEQDRRHLLQAAVKQRQWSVVKRWADHTLYDDQRVWALNEALNEKQWDVALLLADHGLTDIDLMRVHYRLAKYADLDVTLHMFERGADVAEVKERLGRMKDNKRIAESIICCIDVRYSKMKNFEKEIQMATLVAKYAVLAVILHMFERGADVAEVRERLGRMNDNKRIPENIKCCIDDRCSQVEDVEKEIQKAQLKALKTACRSCNWISVLFILIRNPSKECVYSALTIAMKKKAWHVVMQLVRLGIDAKQRHSLFSRMMKRRQWGVCRVLLEQGLSVQLCLKVLPKLMDMNQWALVARVMEHDVGDDVRQQVMQRAWERREGSVVWLCIKSLPTPLSVEEREALFQRAFSCELWQVIKPLVEEKDETGIRHRDTALLEAIDQHQWDLVDHCQRHHADINMKDDDGHYPLQRAAMKKDWEAVEELVVRDGDPNLLDREGYTVLHRAITVEQWITVKLLIEYHADIQKANTTRYGREGVTPLSMLIDARQGDLIKHTLLWCPDQSKVANNVGETALHAACLSGCHESLYHLVARGVNPLSVTSTKQTALLKAVLSKDCPQRMVAECIRLGFSTHQPKLTNIEVDLIPLTSDQSCDQDLYLSTLAQSVTSPSLCAVLRGLRVVMQMLYESGACSQRELFRLYTELPKRADPNTFEGRKLKKQAGHNLDAYNNFVHCIEDITLPYLTEITTTPRSLMSTCRLVISHCLTLSKTRHRDVDQLPLTERMKNFVLFSDLTDPDFGKDTT